MTKEREEDNEKMGCRGKNEKDELWRFDSEIGTKTKHAEGSGAAKLGPMLKKARKKKKKMVMMKKMHPEAGRSSVLAASSPLPSHKPEFVEGSDTVVGLISDTHGVLDHATLSALKARSISTIIHAGDVGDGRRKSRLSSQQVIELLANETGKAVIAVAGNVDEGRKRRSQKVQASTLCGVPFAVFNWSN